MPKITTDEYIKFHQEYLATKPQHLRFGQAFFNKYLTHDEEVGNLFYLTDKEEVIRIIFVNYIDDNVNNN